MSAAALLGFCLLALAQDVWSRPQDELQYYPLFDNRPWPTFGSAYGEPLAPQPEIGDRFSLQPAIDRTALGYQNIEPFYRVPFENPYQENALQLAKRIDFENAVGAPQCCSYVQSLLPNSQVHHWPQLFALIRIFLCALTRSWFMLLKGAIPNLREFLLRKLYQVQALMENGNKNPILTRIMCVFVRVVKLAILLAVWLLKYP